MAELVFALGIIGTGLLAVPVLAGSTAYAVGEARKWPVGLARKPKHAVAFYGVLVLSSAFGIALDFTPLNPIKALYWSAVVNGALAAPVMVMVMLLARSRKVMGTLVIGGWLYRLGWCVNGCDGALYPRDGRQRCLVAKPLRYRLSARLASFRVRGLAGEAFGFQSLAVQMESFLSRLVFKHRLLSIGSPGVLARCPFFGREVPGWSH
jgi:hypothetical protein